MNKQTLDFVRPLTIGNVRLENNLALAPMAGTTDLIYRSICRELGAGLTVTELVSARGIVYDPRLKKTYRYLEIMPEENPVAIQLFGSEPDDFRIAIKTILSHPLLGQCALIDLNMGCPVNKVVRQGAGSALMKDPQQTARVVSASVEAAAEFGKSVTAKIRTGWDEDSINCVEIARILEQQGAAAITVHARTRAQMYSGKADWSQIARVRDAVRVPLYGNGDIDSPLSAAEMLEQTGADGVMIGRAAQGNPWIFTRFFPDSELAAALDFQADEMPPKLTRIEWMLRHLDGMIDRVGEVVAIREMRTQTVCYLRGTHNAASYRHRLMLAATRQEVAAILAEWLQES